TTMSHTLPDLTGTFVDEGYLRLVELLGIGGSAKVYKAIDTTSPSDDPVFFAVKCMSDGAPGSRQRKLLTNEFNTHTAVAEHPGVLSLHRVFIDRNLVFMVFDLCSGDMLDCVVERQLYVGRPSLVKQAFLELLDAVEHCHKMGVYHRDMKPQNVLCNVTGTGIRLADFGAATRLEESRAFGCGTQPYMSPECFDLTRGSYSPRESDTWALAVTLVVLATRHVPWASAQVSDPSYAAFRADPEHFLRRLLSLTDEANDILRRCFHVDPASRPSIAQLRAAILSTECFLVA
ncbi:kinase-like domain-containing protein, partial [Mycena rosella]